MTPHAPGAAAPPPPTPPSPPSEQQQKPRDTLIPRRPSFRRSLRESNLPDDYLEALDAKRRQLDDSIWKYIASKEREYKNFEKELRHRRRTSQGQDGEGSGSNGHGNAARKRRTSAGREGADGKSPPESDAIVVEKVRREEGSGRGSEAKETMDRGAIAGLKDRRASLERDKDFVGVFTPAYLPALSDESQDTPAILERTSSNPEHLLTDTANDLLPPGSFERTNSDSAVHSKKHTRPSQLVLQHRTSSSGSSADGRLASAMKSPTQRPKRKRVSLAVGDAIVAPSDNVPSSLSNNHTSSHSRIRQATLASASAPVQQETPTSMSANLSSVAAAIQQAEQTAVANASTAAPSEQAILSPPMVEKNDFAPMPAASPSKWRIDPDGDLFDLEHEEEGDLPPPLMDSDEEDAEADAEIRAREEDEISARVDVDSVSTSATSNPIFTPPAHERYDPTTGMIPEPEGEPDSAVPYLPSSAKTSQTPLTPGFRRPSVIHDPVFRGAGYAAAEMKAVEDETYGSSYVRPNTKGSFTSGSLGESYMERNAEKMMKLREEKARTAQVRS